METHRTFANLARASLMTAAVSALAASPGPGNHCPKSVCPVTHPETCRQNVISFDFETLMKTSRETIVRAVSTVASAAA